MPSFVGFLYLSIGLALMLAAIEQGQRLDWWRSGIFNAMFWSGAFFTLCALIRRLDWAAENYYRSELLTGLGQAFAPIGLVRCIILQGVFSGG